MEKYTSCFYRVRIAFNTYVLQRITPVHYNGYIHVVLFSQTVTLKFLSLFIKKFNIFSMCKCTCKKEVWVLQREKTPKECSCKEAHTGWKKWKELLRKNKSIKKKSLDVFREETSKHLHFGALKKKMSIQEYKRRSHHKHSLCISRKRKFKMSSYKIATMRHKAILNILWDDNRATLIWYTICNRFLYSLKRVLNPRNDFVSLQTQTQFKTVVGPVVATTVILQKGF